VLAGDGDSAGIARCLSWRWLPEKPYQPSGLRRGTLGASDRPTLESVKASLPWPAIPIEIDPSEMRPSMQGKRLVRSRLIRGRLGTEWAPARRTLTRRAERQRLASGTFQGQGEARLISPCLGEASRGAPPRAPLLSENRLDVSVPAQARRRRAERPGRLRERGPELHSGLRGSYSARANGCAPSRSTPPSPTSSSSVESTASSLSSRRE
jgi:hypothetical protein